MAIKIGGITVIDDSRVISNLSQPLSIAQGGTGLTSAGTSGNVLVSNGTVWTSSTSVAPVGSLVLITATNVTTSVADVSFTGLNSTYDLYIVDIINCLPSTNSSSLRLRTSTDGGSTYDNGASDYKSKTNSETSVQTSSSILITFGISNATGKAGISAILTICTPSVSRNCLVYWNGGFQDTSSLYTLDGTGFRDATTDVDAIQFSMSTGNIESGTFNLYGVKK